MECAEISEIPVHGSLKFLTREGRLQQTTVSGMQSLYNKHLTRNRSYTFSIHSHSAIAMVSDTEEITIRCREYAKKKRVVSTGSPG